LILYLDTSSLVKLYVSEAHSDNVRAWADEAEIIATCRVAYPEAVSALNRRYRNGDIEKKDYDALLSAFSKDWFCYAVIDFDELDAGRLAEAYGLRGFDAVHLSAARQLHRSQRGMSLSFSSFDEKLNRAARSEKLAVVIPKS